MGTAQPGGRRGRWPDRAEPPLVARRGANLQRRRTFFRDTQRGIARRVRRPCVERGRRARTILAAGSGTSLAAGNEEFDGARLGTIGGPGRPLPQFGCIQEIARPGEDTLYVAEPLNWRVQKLPLRP